MLDVKNLSLSIGKNNILQDVSFDLLDNEILSIIGPSGCGKSSILKSVAGIYKPFDGSILMDGVDISTTPIHKRKITLVFQDYSLFPHMTIDENMAVGSPDIGLNNMVLERLGISFLRKKYPHEMSGGEQQRGTLARAIAHSPKLLLLDEPFSNIDTITTRSIRTEIFQLIQEFDISTIMVTHDLEDVFEMSKRCIVMDEKSIRQFDTLDRIYYHPANEFVMNLFGCVTEFNGKKYRPENIKIFEYPNQHTQKFIVKSVDFKIHFNEIVLNVDAQSITIFDHQRCNVKVDKPIYVTFEENIK